MLYDSTTRRKHQSPKCWKLRRPQRTSLDSSEPKERCVINRSAISQAGRRRFDPGLPLQNLKALSFFRPHDGTTNLAPRSLAEQIEGGVNGTILDMILTKLSLEVRSPAVAGVSFAPIKLTTTVAVFLAGPSPAASS